MIRKVYLLGMLFCFTLHVFCLNDNNFTTTTINDSNFEQELINLGYDTGAPNGSVPTANISGVTTLVLNYLGITDLTGIEDFTALEDFTFQGNEAAVTSIDLTSNLNLKTLKVFDFPNLVSINITGLSNLTDVLLSNLVGFTSLDYSNIVSLNKIQISRLSNLSTVNVTGLSALTEFSISNSDVMTSLDLSPLTSLNQLVISNNTQLSNVNLATGTTAAITFVQLNGNTLLTCVEVDAGVPLIGMPTWNQNNGTIFNEDCSNPATYVPDDNFEAYLEANFMGNGILNDDKVTTANINTITVLDVSSRSISDLTGIEDFSALVDLNASSNTIGSIDISKNLTLEKLNINDNNLINIDVSKNTLLKELWIRRNNLINLNISSNLNLEVLDASFNRLQSLDLSKNANLTFLELQDNSLFVLNLKNSANTSISFINTKINPALTCVEVDDVNYAITNWTSQVDGHTNFNTNCSYAETNVPDSFFENYLETHDRNGNVVALGDPTSMGNGVAGDMKVYTHRINTVTTLNVSNVGLSLLTGLEDFRDTEIFNAFGGNPGLTSADLSNNLKLKRITFSLNTNATAVTFGNLPDVEYIQLGFCNIATVDLSGLPNLKEFKDFDSKLTSLDVSSNPNLEILVVQRGILTALDVSANPVLKNIAVTENQITALDVSANPFLKNISLTGNQITALDFSNNPKIESFYVNNNQLTSLNLKNGFNALINSQAFNITNNPGLTCIEVSDANYATTTWTTIDSQHRFSSNCSLAQTYVPDNNLEAYLETHDASGNTVVLGDPTSMGNGIANDDYVFTNRIKIVTQLNVFNQSITDMTGIEDFIALQVLQTSTNNIASIDVSNLLSLYDLSVQSNPITTIDVSQNSNLLILDIGSTSIGNLDVMQNLRLESLNIDYTPISIIDITKNLNLKTFSAENVPLNQVDLSQNSKLEYLELRNNSLSTLDFSSNLLLQYLILEAVPVTSLDLSSYDKLLEIRLNNNASLAQLNLKNGTNTNIPTTSFDITNNPSLTCIEVDDVNYANTNWTSKDGQHVFNTVCSSQQITLIPDPVFEQFLVGSNIDSDGVVNGQVFTADINTVTRLFLACTYNCATAPKITDLSGIEDFAALASLIIQNNNVSGVLDLTNNTNLLTIDVSLNSITDLKLNGLNIYTVNANNNNISSLDLSTSSNLLSVKVSNNNISSLDLSSNPNVTEVFAQNNQLTSINISNNTLLKYLDVKNNQLTVVDLTNKSELYYFDISNNNLTGVLDISNRTKLGTLNCSNNNISELIFKDNLLTPSNFGVSIECANNNITKLDASGSRINKLDASNNSITDLRLTAEADLTLIKLNNNQLTQLDLKSKMSSNYYFYFADFDFRNNNLQCIEVDNPSTLIPIFTNIDSGTTITTDCSSVWTVMTNPATTTALLAVSGLDADNDGEITLAEAAAFTGTLDLSGQSLTDVAGLQAFTNVTVINLQNNNITDFSPLTDASIPIIQKSTGKTKYQTRTGAFNLEELLISDNNAVQGLDVSKLTKLKKLVIKDNPNLITISVKNGNNAAITDFDSSNTPNLSCILVDDPNATYLTTWTRDTKNTFVADEAQCRAEVLSIDNFDVTNNVSLYPNPVKDYLKIELTNQLEIQNIQIYTVIGKLVNETQSLEVDFTKLSKGIYLLKIITDKGIATKKVIKN